MPQAKEKLRKSAKLIRDGLAAYLRRDDVLRINLLHIGKNGGTTVAACLKSLNDAQKRVHFAIRSHRYKLGDVPDGEFAMFVVRDPIDRFRSGFYSRQRQGLPRKLSPWDQEEQRAFGAFPHANDLAEALSAWCPERRMQAIWAMNSIYHVNNMHLDWMPKAWDGGRGKIISILRQEELQNDLGELLAALELEMPSLPKDTKTANRGSYENVPPLSPTAITNLKQWYYRDFMFLDIVRTEWVDEARERARNALRNHSSKRAKLARSRRDMSSAGEHCPSNPGGSHPG